MGSDDEDLEFLRLVALKSRKSKAESEQPAAHNGVFVKNTSFSMKDGTKAMGESRGFRGKKGRLRGLPRNGGINPRVNTNLISIPIEKNIEVGNITEKVLDKDENPDSKFSRYDHSDHSDSESDVDDKKEDSDIDLGHISDGGDSLDRLMDELECLSGKPKPSPVVKVNKGKPTEKVKKPPAIKDSTEKVEESLEEKKLEICDTKKIEVKNDIEVNKNKTEIPVEVSNTEVKVQESNKRIEERSDEKPFANETNVPSSSWKKSSYSGDRRSPYNSRPPYDRHVQKYPRSPPRSYSPLCINTEVLNTITMAPLSPRSAAFVLQNREILAKRKQSPGRRSISSRSSLSSISRSPSPRQRLAPLPRNRVHSPPRRYIAKKRSSSPVYKNEQRRRTSRSRSRSPRNNIKRFSPRPEPRNQSPSRRPALKRRSKSPVNSKRKLYNKIGTRNPSKPIAGRGAPPRSVNPENKRSLSLSLSPSPDRQKTKEPVTNVTTTIKSSTEDKSSDSSKKLDPILEARKKKFESNTPVNTTVGVIKLKKETLVNETNSEEREPSVIDSESDEEDDQNPNLSDLWSSDESDNEKEGRFKLQTSENKNIYTKRPLSDPTVDLKPKRMKHKSSYNTERRSRRDNVTKPSDDSKRTIYTKSSDVDKAAAPTIRPEKPRELEISVENKIKIKSTSLRRTNESDISNKQLDNASTTKTIVTNNKVKEEIDITNENEEKSTNDDLRTELSRRRAQRKAANAPVASARIVQTAFQEMSKKLIGTTNKSAKGTTKTERRVLVLSRSTLEMDQEQSPLNINLDSNPNKVGTHIERKHRVPIRMRLGKTGIENYTGPSLVSSNFLRQSTNETLSKKQRLENSDIVVEKRSHGGHKKRIIALQV